MTSKKARSDDTRPRPATCVREDDLLPQYSLKGAKRNPYAARLAGTATIVRLEPDVAAAFPDAAAVNAALRGLMRPLPKQPRRSARPAPRKG